MAKVANGAVGVGRRPWEMPWKTAEEALRERYAFNPNNVPRSTQPYGGGGEPLDPTLEPGRTGGDIADDVRKKAMVAGLMLLISRGRSAGHSVPAIIQALKQIPPNQLASMLPMTAHGGYEVGKAIAPQVGKAVDWWRERIPERLGGVQ